MRRGGTLMLLSLLAGVVGVVLFAGPAAAHGGDPILSVDQTHPADTSVHYIIKMVWENDGDPINDKTVTATPTGPDGVVGAPVTLTDTGDGLYEATVEMPTGGAWTVTFATVGMDPGGSITHNESRPEPAPTTTAATEPEDEEPAEADAPADDDETAAAASAAEDDDSGSANALILVAALAVAIVGGLGAVRIVRRNSTPKDATPTTTD